MGCQQQLWNSFKDGVSNALLSSLPQIPGSLSTAKYCLCSYVKWPTASAASRRLTHRRSSARGDSRQQGTGRTGGGGRPRTCRSPVPPARGTSGMSCGRPGSATRWCPQRRRQDTASHKRPLVREQMASGKIHLTGNMEATLDSSTHRLCLRGAIPAK